MTLEATSGMAQATCFDSSTFSSRRWRMEDSKQRDLRCRAEEIEGIKQILQPNIVSGPMQQAKKLILIDATVDWFSRKHRARL
jgi:hypothetical protein